MNVSLFEVGHNTWPCRFWINSRCIISSCGFFVTSVKQSSSEVTSLSVSLNYSAQYWASWLTIKDIVLYCIVLYCIVYSTLYLVMNWCHTSRLFVFVVHIFFNIVRFRVRFFILTAIPLIRHEWVRQLVI